MLEKKLINKLWIELIGFSISALIILLAVALAVSKMRSSQGMWRTFDDVQTVRTILVAKELRAGQFPVRLLSDLGHGGGYLLLNFYSPLIYYISSAFVIAGTSALNAAKLAFQLTYLVGGFGMYFLLRQIFSKSVVVPVLGSLLFIGSSYFNFDAYVRGALPELAGFALIPWVFWGYQYLKTHLESKLAIGLFGLSLALVICAHSITAVISFPFVALLGLLDLIFHQIKIKDLLKFLLAGLLALGLAATYVLPVLTEKAFIQYDQVSFVQTGFRSTFVSLSEMVGLNPVTDPTIIPVTLGFWLSLSALVSLILIGWLNRKKLLLLGKVDQAIWLFSVVGLISAITIQNKLSWGIWENSSLLQLTQFPYRFLTITTFLAVLAVCLAISKIKNTWLSLVIGISLISLTWISNQPFRTPVAYYFTDTFKAEDLCGTTTWGHEYLSIWTKTCLDRNNSLPIATGSGQLAVIQTETQLNGQKFQITTNGEPGELIISKYYFPGWQIKTGGQILPVYPVGENGLIGVKLNQGTTKIEASFTDTPIRTLGNSISLVSLLGLISLGGIDLTTITWQYLKQRSIGNHSET